MQAASPKILLERLTEEWGEVADAAIYRELEFEKQLWMRTALRGMARKRDSKVPKGTLKADLTIPEIVKILSLYEDHGMYIIFLFFFI